MIECRECGCNCDPGDLVNGVCEECREREEETLPKMRGISNGRNEAFGQPRRLAVCQV